MRILTPLRRLARGGVRRFARDGSGVSAVEFAIIAPFLVMLYFGTAQLTLAATADRKVSAAATTVGDLIAQDELLSDNELDDVLAAAGAILQPYDFEPLALRMSSVRMDDDGTVWVDWSEGHGGIAPHPDGFAPKIPDGVLQPGESIVLVEAVYDYATPFGDTFFGTFTLRDTAYLRPRRSVFVQRG